jgi:hypothetical protein
MQLESYIYIKDSPMKNILTLLVLLPTLAFSQVSTWRTTGGSVSSNAVTQQVQQSTTQRNDLSVSGWRVNPPIDKNDSYRQQKDYQRPPRVIYNPYSAFPYYGPYGWYNPTMYYWNDEFGWRNRARIYHYEGGRVDTIKLKPTSYSVGIGHTNNKQASWWGLIGGDKMYFIMDYVMTYDIDHNEYYPYGKINNVDFPLSPNDFIKEGTLYFGMGKKVNGFGIHTMIGFGNEVIRYQGKDDLGGISFPKSKSTFTTFKIGLIKEFKIITLKLDTDPIRGYTQIGIGLNNK